ncbi:hypothetical protein GGI26_002946 [Coemansia sp. RSA 1358]|nr:hypothetical protein GGI26_002946 [Coemansia sp. RSA 1358]
MVSLDYIATVSGELNWKPVSNEASDQNGDKNSEQPSTDIAGLFTRALDNIIDYALLPLSIVRFGLRQWITLTELPSHLHSKKQQQAVSDVIRSLHEQKEPYIPLTPTSPDIDLPPGAESFLTASNLLDEQKSPQSSMPSVTNATASHKPLNPQTQLAKDRPLHLIKLSTRFAFSQDMLLLQYNSLQISGLCPISYLDEVLERRGLTGGSSHVKPDSTDSKQLIPIAALRIAPLGVSATLVSVPTKHLGDVEDNALDAWSSALGYSKEFLVEPDADHACLDGRSHMVWITLSKDSEPMLYPQRLVLIDEMQTMDLDADISKGENASASASDEPSSTKGLHAAVANSPSNMEIDRSSALPQELDEIHEEDEDEEGEYDEEGEIAESTSSAEPGRPPLQHPGTIPSVNVELDKIVAEIQPSTKQSLESSLLDIQKSMSEFQVELRVKEEEETRKKEALAIKNAAATSSSRGPTNLTKSSSAKSTSAANGTKKRQRSNTRDEQSNKARRKSNASNTVVPKEVKLDDSNEDIPLQALVTNSSALSTVEATAVQAISQDDAVGTGNATLNNNDTSASSGDIGSLFGDAGIGESASGIVDGVGNMDDDMGLGMGLGMGMDMGDFASSMFGITDDDFNFFDSVPSHQPKAEDPMAVFSQPDLEAASSVDVEPKSHGVFHMEIDTDELDKPPINAHASAEINTAIPEQPMQDMDDLFDDGVFDSFFGGQTSAPSSSGIANLMSSAIAPIKQEEEPGSSENAYGALDAGNADIKPQVKSEVDNQLMDSSAIGMADVVSSLSVDSKATLSALSLSSPPGLTSIISSVEGQAGMLDSIQKSLAPAASATADMATPASIKMTPVPSVDLQTPTPTAQMVSFLKGSDTSDEHASLMTTGDSPATLATNRSGSLPTYGDMVPPAIPEDSEIAYQQPSTSSYAKSALQAQVAAASYESKGKRAGINPKITTTSMTPKHYSFVSTPYDDISTSSKSWLRDNLTSAPMASDVSISQEADSQETQYISLVEKSLNPIAWLKRISARRIQQHQMGTRDRNRWKSVSSSTPTSGPGALPSIRRLRGWLASYKAKSMYTRDFVPKHVRELMLASGDGVAESGDIKTHHQPSTIALGESTLSTSDGHNGDGGSATTCLSKAANSDGIKPELVSNLQYPSTGRADARDFDNSYASASLLSSDQQPQHNSGLPSFTSIINPRKSQKQVHAHMPGSLMPSLSIHDLQKAMDVSTPLNILESSYQRSRVIVRAKTISGSWVPTWMLISKGFADAFINSQIAFRLAWEDSVSSLAHVVKDSLLSMSGDDVVRLMNISLAPFLFSSQILKTTGQLSQENTNTHDLGARIGSLLMLGTDRINKSKVDNAQECDPAGNSDVAKDNQTDSLSEQHQSAAADAAFNKWLVQLHQNSDWTGIVEMLADWAVGSCFLACRQCCTKRYQGSIVTSTVNSTQEIGPALSSALGSFWHLDSTNSQYQDQRDNGASMDIDSVAGTSNQIDDDEAGSLAEEPLTLSKLLALESSKPSPTSKYRGFVVKKRRALPQLSGIYGNAIGSTASAHPSGSTTNSNANSAIVSTANASGTSGSSAAYAGSIVVPSGPGIIEPLLDVRILVGSYGQEDVAIPSSGGATLKSRDAESIYVKRWRYAQKLASRATHEARVATGEIEETEEGEEKEEGEDEVVDEAHAEPVEDWPDPDNYAMEAEDALRRVCISTSPVSLRWWSQMQMRPIGASKDVRWVSFIPPFFSLSSAPSLISDPQRSSFIGEEGDASALVREWCQSCSNVAQWYLGDVDSFYQAMHFGAHRPLGLQKTLDGTFTQLTESLLPAASNIAESLEWSARLRYEAERLGQCMAHGWYTNSQLEQQKKTQEAVEGTLMAGGGSALGSLPATTLVLYMLVPHSSHMAIWLAMSEASNITLRAFESTLGSLITRTSLGVPSSTTTVSSQVPWPAIVVHPLPLDLLSEWYCGRRPGIVPSAQETAMSVYNRCPEFLTPAPSLLTPLSASQLAGSFGTTPNPSNAGVGTNPTVAPNGNSPVHGVCEWKQEAGAFVAAVSSASDSLAAQGNTHHLGAGQLSRHSGYFAHTHDQQQVSTPGKPSSGHHFGITGFAHRAYIVSMPCTFPSHSGAFVPATMSLSRTGQRRDIVGEQLPDAHGSRSSVQRPTAACNVAALEEDSQVASKTDDEVSCELAEVHVRFDCVQRSALSPGTATADTSNLYSKLIDHPLRPSDQIATLHCVYMVVKQKWIAICWCDERGEYVEHDVFDLRAGVQEDTQREVSALSPAVAARIWRGCLRYQRLFCGRQNQLRVVLGEWQGMAQMQALQWHAYAEAWNAYIARRPGILLHLVSIGVNPPDGLHLTSSYVQLPSAPQQGCTVESTIPGALNSSSSEVCEKLANRHFSVVLHGQHPHLGYRCDAETLASDPNGWSTGYMVLQDHRTCTKAVPCFCVQLLDARDGDHKRSLLATRAILKQYHQLAVLRDAERNLIALDAEEFGEWPANLLPLPVAVVQDICSALEAII